PSILSFGVAKVDQSFEEESDDAERARDSKLETRNFTETGQFLGSLPWASPEQAEGFSSRLDLRSDVYSLGVILFQVLTLKFPYDVLGPVREVLGHIVRDD